MKKFFYFTALILLTCCKSPEKENTVLIMDESALQATCLSLEALAKNEEIKEENEDYSKLFKYYNDIIHYAEVINDSSLLAWNLNRYGYAFYRKCDGKKRMGADEAKVFFDSLSFKKDLNLAIERLEEAEKIENDICDKNLSWRIKTNLKRLRDIKEKYCKENEILNKKIEY
ncbi:MAG: hypothetical protein CSB55_00030 [Candidatus Cloacimonadota bacterium]|nr:MAG: hypothetical protein CSB55_00030 [Candidatus Cloacimonadota bacterium]